MGKINITLVRSFANRPKKARAIAEGLGLHKLHQTVTHEDNPSIRGSIAKISDMVEVSEAE